MYLPEEVWLIIFSYVSLYDLMEISCACKSFCCLSKKDKFFMKKIEHSKEIFKDRSWLISHYEDMCLCFFWMLIRKLKQYVPARNLDMVRFIVSDKLFYSILPFLFWNHRFLCTRSQFEKTCRLCTKIYIKHKKYLSNSKITFLYK